ncbi:MAG: efflux RND transporter periplasmic adaptor subunit [Polyangiales bacterium]
MTTHRTRTAHRACALLCALWVVGCEREAPAAETPPPPPVHVRAVESVLETPTTAGTAEIRGQRTATLRAEAPGRIIAVSAERGQRVAPGDVLVRLDTGRTAAAVSAANAGIEQAQANLAQMTRERDLAERLAAQGGLATQQLDRARDAVRLAEAALAQAQAQQRLTRRGLTEAVLRAPFAGTIVERVVEEGEFVAPGAPMLMLVDTEHLEARVLLDPRHALDVRPGAEARVTVFARGGEVFQGRVLRTSEVVDSRTRRLPVDVEVLDPEGRLRPGLMARVDVTTGPAVPALAVPAGAVFERFGRDHVYVVSEGTAQRRAVVVASRARGQAVLESGVTAGDQVIVAGLERVVPDGAVNVVPREQASAQGTTARNPRDGDAEPAAP